MKMNLPAPSQPTNATMQTQRIEELKILLSDERDQAKINELLKQLAIAYGNK